MNYVSNLAAQQTAGGPDAAVATEPLEERDGNVTGRAMRIVDWSTGGPPVREPGRAVRSPVEKASIAVEIDSLGDETAALFTLNFDASRLSNPVVTLADGMPEGMTLTANTRRASDGRVIILLDSSTPFNTRLSTRVVTVTFDVVKGAPFGETPITFDGSGSMSDAAAHSLDAVYHDGVVTIKGRAFLEQLLVQSSSFSLHLRSVERN